MDDLYRRRVLQGLGFEVDDSPSDPTFGSDPVWAALQRQMAKQARAN
jgi:hypothetical protein